MRKYSFWINVFLLTFLLGVSAAAIWFLYGNKNPEIVEAPPFLVKQDCGEKITFPGLAQKISEVQKGRSIYFPKNVFSDVKWKEQDDFLNNWYGKNLKAMNEKSLLDISDENIEVYRFLWLRTFHHPIFVRIEHSQNQIKLFTKELNGAGGYDPGKILRSYERKIDENEWCNFLKLIGKIDYWPLPTSKDVIGVDGSQWILEGVKDKSYHVVDQYSPENGNFREACIYLLKLSGVDTDKLGDDLY